MWVEPTGDRAERPPSRFEDVVRQALPDCHIVTVPDPEHANICGYAELAASLEEDRWEVR